MRARRTAVWALGLVLAWGVSASGTAMAADGFDGTQVDLQLVAEGFNSPVYLVSPPDGTERLFVVDRAGVIYAMGPDGEFLSDTFLDLRDRMVPLNASYDERGLLGLAFHPDYAENGRFYVYYSAPLQKGAPANWDHTSRVSEFTVTETAPNVADPDSERVLIEIDQPQSNHNGGALAFGPDGYLYISLGDGGAANDSGVGHPEIGNGQDVTTLLGSILRIDVDRGWPGYAVPADNPFVGRPGRDEIYAWGFRNPFRMSFDRGGDHELFVADVGQNLFEEVNIVHGPGNYGWRIREATHCFDRAHPSRVPVTTDCPATGPRGEELVDPILEYPHRDEAGNVVGISIIGGYVYRGSLLPDLYGKYVFADWSTSFSEAEGKLFVAAAPDAYGELWPFEQVKQLDAYVLGMGEDAGGELYVLTTDEAGPSGETGKVYKLVPAGM